MEDLFPEQSGGGAPGCLPVLAAILLIVVVTCAFLMAVDVGVFDTVGKVGSGVIDVLDELWSQE